MGLSPILVITTFFWLLLHAYNYWVSSHKKANVLPLTHPALRQPTIDFTLKGAFAQIYTKRLNNAHRLLSTRISHGRAKTIIHALYGLGALAALVFLIFAVVTLPVVACYLVKDLTLSRNASNPVLTDQSALFKRDAPASPRQLSGNNVGDSHFSISPIIPGVNVPLFHLPLIIMATFLCEVVHEAGHAIPAAADAVPLISVGAWLAVVLPGAFVALSSSTMSTLAPWPRMRIASGGAWHNLLLWCILGTVSWTGLNGHSVYTALGWRSVSGTGLSVTAIHDGSPLQGHILPSSLVDFLDDEPISSIDAWSHYLLSDPNGQSVSEGWCVSDRWLREQGNECCRPTVDGDQLGTSCFLMSPYNAETCINPVLLFMPSSQDVLPSSPLEQRCHDSCSPSVDGTEYACIRPREDQSLLRIHIQPPPWSEDEPRTIVWRGPRREIWDQLEMGVLQPLHVWVPGSLPTLVSLFVSYISLVTLSLFALNLLPLPRADGAAILNATLDLCFAGNGPDQDSYDLEEGVEGVTERIGRSANRWKRRIEMATVGHTSTFLAIVLLASLWREIG